MNIPNLITFGRLIAVPVTIWLILGNQLAIAFWVFVAAGISDALDGWIAKRFDLGTELGRYLDPIADKALLVAVYMTLGAAGHLPDWLVILVVFRDAAILGGALLAHTLHLNIRVEPLAISKVNTAAQIVLAAAVLGRDALPMVATWTDGAVLGTLIALVAVTTLWSGIRYLLLFQRHAGSKAGGP
ncbi:MAG: CDP-alcohol phosphatidyltransferase family protein [Alphaproteobacteria bacterium]|nr:CDP-alcohol phosphatidyltransferase family protein [Alphaproteobacteria bacterium]